MCQQIIKRSIRLKITNAKQACLISVNTYLIHSMRYFWLLIVIALSIIIHTRSVYAQEPDRALQIPDEAFPVSVQFSRVPSGKGWKDENPPLTSKVQHETIQNIIGHGFTNLSVGAFSGDQTQELLTYAQAMGMKIDFTTNGFEMFDRQHPPAISVYSPDYAAEVKKRVAAGLATVKQIERIHTVFPFKDEPFHAGSESFDYSHEAQGEFIKRYGYDMPVSLESVKNDPKKWLDLLNFQSSTFQDGWRQVYKIVKEFDPRPKVVMTHDSHNTFGAGVKSNSNVAMDDVFHWGGDYADLFIYDIYPYTMFDYRYGELGKLPKPRLSQMHYTISQLRNVTTTFNKELGFWVGTFNKRWFKRFMSEEMRQQYWAERELAYTAVAHGANFLITGLNIPEDSLHWDDFGKGMNVIRQAGEGLLKAPKVKASACFLFPRTQYLQLQEEYYNVGLTFELFLRAFGELDILHEEQITDDNLNGYEILVLGDVKLLPENVAGRIASFVSKGGIVVSDCVPQMDAYKQPMDVMAKLFGVGHAETNRIIQEGQWVPFTILTPKMSFPPSSDRKQEEIKIDMVAGKAFGNQYDFRAISPRAMQVTNGEVMLEMKSGLPTLVRREVGKGKVYLFGFCLQDTYFRTWKDSEPLAREQLYNLVSDVIKDSKVQSHIFSSNPEIEATIRANSREGYLFIINHEALRSETVVRLSDIGFQVRQIVDIDNGEQIVFKKKKGVFEFSISAPFGTTRLLRVLPE